MTAVKESENMKFSNPYWSYVLKVNALQRWILVQSIIYYNKNESIVTDKEYDDNQKQLVEMMKHMPMKDKTRTRYWYVFKDFEGSTGFDLVSKLRRSDRAFLLREANNILGLLKRIH